MLIPTRTLAEKLDIARDEAERLAAEVARLAAENARQHTLLRRSLAIIADAIGHGMPITEEVAAVRNEIVGATTR